MTNIETKQIIDDFSVGYFMIATRGIPGCGKSTWAKNVQDIFGKDEVVIVNRDTIRAEYNCLGPNWTKDKERDVVKERDRRIAQAMKLKTRIVINDDTNIIQSNIDTFNNLANHFNYKFFVQDMLSVPIQTCIDRDAKREGYAKVGSEVIMRMARQAGVWKDFEKRQSVPVTDRYIQNEDLPKCIICDIDGTIANLNGRDAYTTDETLLKDLPRKEIITVVKALFNSQPDCTIFFFSGREGNDSGRKYTDHWLKFSAEFHVNKYGNNLRMRKTGDTRKDTIVKKEMFNEHIRDKYNVIAVFDDRQSVCEMWLSMGLPLFNVGDGSVF